MSTKQTMADFRIAGQFNSNLRKNKGEHRTGGTHQDNREKYGVARPGKTLQDKVSRVN